MSKPINSTAWRSARRVALCLGSAAALAGEPAAAQFDFELLLSVESVTSDGPTSDSVIVVGSDGQPTDILVPRLNAPRGTALAPDGTFFVSVTGGLGAAGGTILRVDPAGAVSPFLTDVSPLDLEIDPVSGDLFASNFGVGILRVPVSGPGAGVPITGPNSSTPGVFVDSFTMPDGTPGARQVAPSGLGFAPNGDLFAGLQPTDASIADTAGLLQVDVETGLATQVGLLDNPFDVQVDSRGNVFANNVTPGAALGETVGEIAFFPGLGLGDVVDVAGLVDSQTFSQTAIRGLAVGPVGTVLEDSLFASTGELTIVRFEPFDPSLPLDTAFGGELFSDNVQNPFAFDIRVVVPEPSAAAAALTVVVATAAPLTRSRRAG